MDGSVHQELESIASLNKSLSRDIDDIKLAHAALLEQNARLERDAAGDPLPDVNACVTRYARNHWPGDPDGQEATSVGCAQARSETG